MPGFSIKEDSRLGKAIKKRGKKQELINYALNTGQKSLPTKKLKKLAKGKLRKLQTKPLE